MGGDGDLTPKTGVFALSAHPRTRVAGAVMQQLSPQARERRSLPPQARGNDPYSSKRFVSTTGRAAFTGTRNVLISHGPKSAANARPK
ncbi:MAG: hypothetical protein K0R39_3076 [Symbiobacteriaceae bacterium]|nr:hypothetical protein [Symbiobacteriaceae bacterium]